MYASHDRDELEERTIAAHGLYIEALDLVERLQAEDESGSPVITGSDLIQAECLLAERRSRLMELLNALGYMPAGFTVRLRGRPYRGECRPEAMADPDLAALRRTYLEWRGHSDTVKTGRAAHPMMNLGRILTLLGALPEEDEIAEELGGATALH